MVAAAGRSFRDRPRDALLLGAEITVRQVYYRWRGLNQWNHSRRQPPPAPQVCSREKLRERLAEIGVGNEGLVMVHSSVRGMRLTNADGADGMADNPLSVSACLFEDLEQLVGATGTLVMPTRPLFKNEPVPMDPARVRTVFRYDPARTPCRVGLVNELFRRSPRSRRSLHPINTLSCSGPLSDELLKDNLNHQKPLPHGLNSGYHRICDFGGRVVSLGVPLWKYLTIMHVGEDVRDESWPVRNFFVERTFAIRQGDSWQNWTVRQRRWEFQRCLCLSKLHRDLLREGILHEGKVGSIRIDWANAREIRDFLMTRNTDRPYPYYCTWAAGPIDGAA